MYNFHIEKSSKVSGSKQCVFVVGLLIHGFGFTPTDNVSLRLLLRGIQIFESSLNAFTLYGLVWLSVLLLHL